MIKLYDGDNGLGDPERLDKFMLELDENGEDAAMDKYGDPQYWTICKHGQGLCRYRYVKHSAVTCVHESYPQGERAQAAEQLVMF